MRPRDWIGALAVAAAVGVACASTMTVSSHVERGLDFSRYRTFDWGPADALPTGDPRLDRNPLFKDNVQGAVEKQLARRGLLLSTAEQADLLIHYHASIQHRIDVDRTDRALGYCQAGDCPPGTAEYEAGTLVIDIIDARSHRLIWRGWAQRSVADVLHDPDRLRSMIDEAVTRMLARLPGPL